MKLQFTVFNDALNAIVNIAAVVIFDAVAAVNIVVVLNFNAVAVINDAAVAFVKCCCSCSCQ